MYRQVVERAQPLQGCFYTVCRSAHVSGTKRVRQRTHPYSSQKHHHHTSVSGVNTSFEKSYLRRNIYIVVLTRLSQSQRAVITLLCSVSLLRAELFVLGNQKFQEHYKKHSSPPTHPPFPLQTV